MKLRWALFPGLIIGVFLLVSPRTEAVNQSEINAVLEKQVLNQQDLAVIDTFLAEAIDELVKTRDFTKIAQTRAIILSKKSGQGQYAQQFTESARKYIAEGLKKAQTLPEDRGSKVLVNLLILIDRLQDLQMADLSLGLANNQKTIVRYWVVHSLSNPGFVGKMLAGGDNGLRLGAAIADRFRAMIDTSKPEVLALMTQFATQVKVPQSEQLLIQIADARIDAYSNWTVEYELVDSSILKALAAGITPNAPNRDAFAQRFTQLLSCSMQRLIKGVGRLTQQQMDYLVSVLAEVETKCLARLLDPPQGAVKRALESQDMNALQTEYNRLFGQTANGGEIVNRLQFNFGQDSTGRDIKIPKPLPDPPAPKTPVPPVSIP